jgi:hypothetical protein
LKIGVTYRCVVIDCAGSWRDREIFRVNTLYLHRHACTCDVRAVRAGLSGVRLGHDALLKTRFS